jgi:purine nucleosidase
LPTPILIDTDTASDDAVALVMALRSPEVSVEAITVVAGNVSLEQGSRNARYTVELCGADVPVYEGAARPLLRDAYSAQYFHGQDGLGDQGYPPPRRPAAQGHAVDVILETVRAHPGLILVTLGPLTNLALALLRAPEAFGQVGRCVVMGGAACTVGNVTPAAEYNIWCDPEAARICFRSGLPIEMVGWELCRGKAVLNAADIARCRAIGTPEAHFTVDCNAAALEANRRLFDEDGIGLPDPVAMAVALDPGVVTRRSGHAVDVASGHQTLQSRPAFCPIANVNTIENRDARNTSMLANSSRKSCASRERAQRRKILVFSRPRRDRARRRAEFRRRVTKIPHRNRVVQRPKSVLPWLGGGITDAHSDSVLTGSHFGR